ncbi:MAG: Flp family type IVb pilin [Phycisphaerae bacterium]|nr:Flp family type IVb pilin [Phycisphaerae bacterium]
MNTLKQLTSRFLKEEEGLETIEYAIMTALIVAGLVAALGLLSTAIEGRFTDVQGTVDGIN